ncbi:hypothetical protein SAY87_030114 [Trapa incisa]|uniref:Uncharacterized protein n=1 Tax=Trapa incisa TaxID=236973 RepID=A0AAN7QE03_9MYRT|nr:hypothetical protein SAY87_030114 [Trapa incisa]
MKKKPTKCRASCAKVIVKLVNSKQPPSAPPAPPPTRPEFADHAPPPVVQMTGCTPREEWNVAPIAAEAAENQQLA